MSEIELSEAVTPRLWRVFGSFDEDPREFQVLEDVTGDIVADQLNETAALMLADLHNRLLVHEGGTAVLRKE